jgi:hypothetical protein
MTHATAAYNGEEIQVTFRARMVRNDYGVPGSPVWYEPDDTECEIVTLTMLGIDVDVTKLPADLRDAIYALAGEVKEWTRDED